jgi:2-haloacid dehalogenase/putative hydrolase of the HAD superfamily
MTPKAVIWDFGNVIVRWDARTLYSKIFPDPARRDWFLANVCTPQWNVKMDGGASFTDECAALAEKHPEHHEAIWAWRDRWAEMFSGAIPETEAAIEALHQRGVPQFGLSNISHETLEMTLALSPSFGRLRGYVASGVERLLKPDPAIFRLTCERFGLDPAQTLFVDDSARNIAAAQALGFDVHHFTDPAALRPALAARGLL